MASLVTETNNEKTDQNITLENKKQLFNYLDKDVLQIKTIQLDEILSGSNLEKPNDDIDFGDLSNLKPNNIIKAKVVFKNEKFVYLDIGFKTEGIIPISEFSESPNVGEEHDVFIQDLEDRHGKMRLSKEKAEFISRWNAIKEIYKEEKLITGKIIKRIKGGMVVDLGTVQAFLPGSQIDVKPITDFDQYINVETEFKIVKINEMRQNVVVSRKAILAGSLEEKRQEVMESLEVGTVLEGVVKNITDFGAFIDLGGFDGLLHITDITWSRINHPSEKLKIGETVQVKVIDFDVEKFRVSLGMKQLTEEPWKNISEKYPVDSIINGKVVNIMNYGLFVELEEGIEGLVHISEISWIKHLKHPSDLYTLGEEIECKVLSINESERKISLGIKQLQENPWDKIESKFEINSTHKGVVKNLTQFGAFIELEEGIDGLAHISDLSWVRIVKHPNEILKVGEEIEVKILEVSSNERKLSLGIKQLLSNPWDEVESKFTVGQKVPSVVNKIIDKGIIFTLENDIEGIAPLKNVSTEDRSKLKDVYIIDKEFNLSVEAVDVEAKKIILSLD
ncbi:MAG: hypothetical protein CBD58_01420 [bacterium TMED198]|nr:MAG: hypothetical protein CBD58_01420 [bacterium TMED198]